MSATYKAGEQSTREAMLILATECSSVTTMVCARAADAAWLAEEWSDSSMQDALFDIAGTLEALYQLKLAERPTAHRLTSRTNKVFRRLFPIKERQ